MKLKVRMFFRNRNVHKKVEQSRIVYSVSISFLDVLRKLLQEYRKFKKGTVSESNGG